MSLPASRLPHASALRRRTQALAMLDALLSPEWEARYYSHDAHWGDGLEMASMRNGQGDDWFVLFGPFGAAIKGLAHETPLAADGAFAAAIQRAVPPTFADFLHEPAFTMARASFCYWTTGSDPTWHRVTPAVDAEDDGSDRFLELLVQPALGYVDFAARYFEVDLALYPVTRLYAHAPLTPALVAGIDPTLAFDEAARYAAEIGYPLG